MKGTKRYLSGAWRLQAWDAGRRKYVTRTVRAPNTKAGQKEADTALRSLVDSIERGSPDSHITIGEVLDRWLKVKASSWQPRTFDTNRAGAEHLKKRLGKVRIDRLRVDTIEDAYVELANSLSPASVRRIHGVLHAALETAVGWDLIRANSAHRVTPPAVTRRSNTTPSPDQLLRLLAAVDDQPDFAAFARLAASTGARRGSVSALRWSDIDLDRATVTFLNKFSVSTQGVELRPGSKTGRQYQVVIGLDVVGALRRWRAEQDRHVVALGAAMPADPFVFTSPLDPRVARRPDHWTRIWRRLTRSVDPSGGLDHIRLHDLKHYSATQLLAGGMPLLQVADRLGMSPALLISLYGHSIPAADRHLADHMTSLMAPGH